MDSSLPQNEAERLAELDRYSILASSTQVAFDRIAGLAARLFRCQFAWLTIVTADKKLVRCCAGISSDEIPHDSKFCNWAALESNPVVVADTHENTQFRNDPLVTGPVGVRFYAAAPLITPGGFHLGAICIFDTQPRPGGFGAEEIRTLQDLVALAMSELELRAAIQNREHAEARVAFVMDNVPVLISYINNEERFVHVNQQYEEFFGHRREHLIGRTVADVGGPEHYARAQEYIDRVLRGQQVAYDSKARHRDGTLHDIHVSYTPDRKPDGSICGFIALVQDITERKLAEDALSRSEARFRLLSELGEATRLISDPEQIMAVAARKLGELMQVSRCAYATVEADSDRFTIRHDYTAAGVASTTGNYQLLLFGPRAVQDMMAGRTLVVRNVDRELAPSEGADMFRAIGIQGIVCCPHVQDGRLRAMMAVHSTTPRDWTDDEIRLVETVVERSWAYIERARADRELAEANQMLRRANEGLEEFAYVVSHDLQEPLRVVKSFTQLLLRKLGPQPDKELADFGRYIQTGTERMEVLIRDLLSYSVDLHTAKDVPVCATSLEMVLQKALSMVEAGVSETGAVITHDPLPTVVGDETQLIQVLQNLLSNAIKYRKENVNPQIHISAAPENGQWLISVRDNGIGFDPRYAARIFGLFRRLSRDKYPGTGLGLAICKRIVERLGGRIWAESQPGRGSTFLFTLKAADSLDSL